MATLRNGGDYKTQQWINGTGTVAGQQAQLRKNVGVSAHEATLFPHLVLVTLLYRVVAPDGRPGDADEWRRLDSTEERLADAMRDACGACFALIVTSDGKRDLFFYLPEPATDRDTETLIQSIAPSVDYEFSIRSDPEWRPYRALLPDPPRALQ